MGIPKISIKVISLPLTFYQLKQNIYFTEQLFSPGEEI